MRPPPSAADARRLIRVRTRHSRGRAAHRSRRHASCRFNPIGSMTPGWEHDTRRDGGGFAALEAFCRRVAGVSRLYWCNSPRLVAVRPRSGAVRSRSGAVRCPHRRPPRRQTPTTGCRGRGRLHRGHNDAWPRASLAREPAIACVNRLYRTSTRYSVSGQGCPRSHQRVNVRISGPTLALAGPGAD